MNRFNRRQRAVPTPPERKPGQRLGLRPQARQKFVDDRAVYKNDLQNNQILDELERRAGTRGKNINDMGDLEYGVLEGQLLTERALKQVAPYAALSGIGAAGVGYAMNNGAVGVDPLSAARNNVAQANAVLGSERMLEALTLDQIDSMQAQADALSQSQNAEPAKKLEGQFNADVMALAQELMAYPDMDASQAITRATEIMHSDYRASGAY